MNTNRKVCESQLSYANAVGTCLQRVLLPVVRKQFHVFADCSHLHNTLLSSVFCVESHYMLKKTRRLLVRCFASSVKASQCVCLCALNNRFDRKRIAKVGIYSNVPVHVHSTGFMYLITGADKIIMNIGTHIHKFYHPLGAQHFYIYNTQRLQVSATYPGHLQGVTSLLDLCSLYTIHPGHIREFARNGQRILVTRAHGEETCTSLKMTRIYGRNM